MHMHTHAHAHTYAYTYKVADMLAGEWLLGFTVRGDSISFAPPEANQQITVAAGRDPASTGTSTGTSTGDRVARGSYVRLTPSYISIHIHMHMYMHIMYS